MKRRCLIACEFSGVVRDAFAAKGWDAWSVDLLPSDRPGNHIKGDILEHLDGWNLMVAHPPCTWLCQAMRTNAARKDRPNITPIFETELKKAFNFFMALFNAPIERIAVENPIGYINSAFRKPDQIFRAWQFGEPYKKETCLWLKNLPPLIPTHTEKPGSLKTYDFWSTSRNPNGRSRKSITFQSVANAMATQWSG